MQHHLSVFGRSLSHYLLCVILSATAASAHYGTAPNGYYPGSYNGAIFTGQVVQSTDDTISLTYSHGSKTDSFTGRVTVACHFPSSKDTLTPMPLTQIPVGSVITVFYDPKTIKVGGQKQKENRMIAIAFQEMNGKPVAEDNKLIFFCLPTPMHTVFRSFLQ